MVVLLNKKSSDSSEPQADVRGYKPHNPPVPPRTGWRSARPSWRSARACACVACVACVAQEEQYAAELAAEMAGVPYSQAKRKAQDMDEEGDDSEEEEEGDKGDDSDEGDDKEEEEDDDEEEKQPAKKPGACVRREAECCASAAGRSRPPLSPSVSLTVSSSSSDPRIPCVTEGAFLALAGWDLLLLGLRLEACPKDLTQIFIGKRTISTVDNYSRDVLLPKAKLQ
eukprot:8834202-Pyramimonas_sp.AAC.2